jgi:hypothetical protein
VCVCLCVDFDFGFFPFLRHHDFLQEWHKLSDMEVNMHDQTEVPIFIVKAQGEEKLTLECKDVEATQEWVKSLNEAIDKCKSSEKAQRQRKWDSRSRSALGKRNSTLGKKTHSTLNAKEAEELKAMAIRAKSMAQNEAKYKTVGGVPSSPAPDSALFDPIADTPSPTSSSSASKRAHPPPVKRMSGSGKYSSGKFGSNKPPAMPGMGDMMSEMMTRRANLRKTKE